MSRQHSNSYEGFRRKNSLSSLNNNTKSSAPPDFSFLKLKHKEDLKLVENLSMELQKFSKGTSIHDSLYEHSTSLQSSARSIGINSQQISEQTYFNSTGKKHNASLQNISMEAEEEEFQKKQKVTANTLFNKFDIIEESSFYCEEELPDQIEVIKKPNDQIPPARKSAQTKQPVKTSIPLPRKVTLSSKGDTIKQEKMKSDITELDKMKKELQSKRFTKESTANKTVTIGVKRQKQLVPPGLGKPKYSHEAKVEIMKPIRNGLKQSASVTTLSTKLAESKMSMDEKKVDIYKIQEEPMVATRMLSEKQKGRLVGRLMELREVIEKNEVCSDYVEEITYHLTSIQKLLTE